MSPLGWLPLRFWPSINSPRTQRLNSPEAAPILRNEFLVDNLLTGAPDLTSRSPAANPESDGLEKPQTPPVGLELHTSSILADLKDDSAALPIDDGGMVKTIGILWCPRQDTLSVKI